MEGHWEVAERVQSQGVVVLVHVGVEEFLVCESHVVVKLVVDLDRPRGEGGLVQDLDEVFALGDQIIA